jgi:hypothetical protein
MLVEKKVLLVSKHKNLLTQTAFSLMSFIFPLCWKHNIIPILPASMIDVLDAPFPFLIGVEAAILAEYYPSFESRDVTMVLLDENVVESAEKISETLRMPVKELKVLREKLMRATASIKQRPDPELM